MESGFCAASEACEDREDFVAVSFDLAGALAPSASEPSKVPAIPQRIMRRSMTRFPKKPRKPACVLNPEPGARCSRRALQLVNSLHRRNRNRKTRRLSHERQNGRNLPIL